LEGMIEMKNSVKAATVALVAIFALGLGVAPASASEAGPLSLCSGSNQKNTANNKSITFTRASGANSSVTGGPGVTLTISKSTTFSVSGSITGSSSVSASVVVATVQAQVGATIGASYSGTSSSSGAWTVPSTYQIGRLEIGSNKYAGTVTHYVENSNCVWVQSGTSAAYDAPAKEWHFKTSKVA